MNESHADLVEHTTAEVAPPEEELIEADALIEEVSIDGMCGVY